MALGRFHPTDAGLGGDLGAGPGELARHRGADRVHRLGPVEHDLGHPVTGMPRHPDRFHIGAG